MHQAASLLTKVKYSMQTMQYIMKYVILVLDYFEVIFSQNCGCAALFVVKAG